MERPGRALPKAMAEEGVGRKLWLAVAVAELTVIVILATALVYLLTHKEEGHELAHKVDTMNQTLRAAAENWTACQNQTRWLAANSSALRSEAAQLSARLQQQEQENKLLKGELAVLQNWTLKLEDLTNHQKEIIARLRHQPKAFSGALHNGPPFLVLPVAVAIARRL